MASAKGYDVAIVGAGPAGIFSALELSRDPNLHVLLLERGKDISKRSRSAILSGWGGAGAFSDGKLNYSTETGGWLKDYLGGERLNSLLEEVDRIYLHYGAPKTLFGSDEDAVSEISRKATAANLKLVTSRVRHLGTDLCPRILQRMRRDLEERIEIRTECGVRWLLVEGGKAVGVETESGERIEADHVVVSPGRSGADWLRGEAARLGLATITNPVDIGIRVEVPNEVMAHLTKVLYEAKIVYYSKAFDDRVRTFCVCPNGYVVSEHLNDMITVNGHSYATKKTGNTNFALLVSTRFTEPFKDTISYGKFIARLANLLVGGVMVQRLGDLQAGRRSTPERLARSIVEPTLKEAQPGDLSFVLPGRHLTDLREMLQALEEIMPGVCSKHTLLYGVEVKFYSTRIKLTPNLETEVSNLFAAGDGAGITRGLVQSSVSGLVIGREILRKRSSRTVDWLPITGDRLSSRNI